MSSAPDADLASTPVASGECRAVVTMALHREGRSRAQDRADIMRVGDLVEHQHGAFRGDVLDVERGEGIGFHQQALMHGIGPEPRVDRVRPHDLRRDRQREAFLGQAMRAVFGREDLADRAARIGERRHDGVPAVEDRDAFRDCRDARAWAWAQSATCRTCRACAPARASPRGCVWGPIFLRAWPLMCHAAARLAILPRRHWRACAAGSSVTTHR